MRWNSYIGLFSGTLFIGLGIALRYMPVPATVPWIQDLASYFLIGYGLLRLGVSAYFLWKERRPSNLLVVTGLMLLLLVQCKSDRQDNLRIRFAYDGECASCPLSRMDSVLRLHFPRAILQVDLDSAHQQVVLHLDSNYVRMDTLIQVLLAYGYEINEQIPSDPVLSPCCTPIEAALQPASGAVLAEANPQEDVSLLEQDLEAHLTDEPALPHEEFTIEDELTELENFDLHEGGELGMDEGLEDFELEEDLDLDLDSKPKKGSTQKSSSQKPQ